ncbi:hypothetical protein PG994_004044 [Apiospora phragmitis]|uniref:Uncharacterized protein n=1 Tax=Apiospora phragmitis TaxID=2905665 RepID=A0ABR1VZU3_9PEZI
MPPSVVKNHCRFLHCRRLMAARWSDQSRVRSWTRWGILVNKEPVASERGDGDGDGGDDDEEMTGFTT